MPEERKIWFRAWDESWPAGFFEVDIPKHYTLMYVFTWTRIPGTNVVILEWFKETEIK